MNGFCFAPRPDDRCEGKDNFADFEEDGFIETGCGQGGLAYLFCPVKEEGKRVF